MCHTHLTAVLEIVKGIHLVLTNSEGLGNLTIHNKLVYIGYDYSTENSPQLSIYSVQQISYTEELMEVCAIHSL